MATLDLFELDHNDPDKLSIPLNFSSVDYRDIGIRKGSFSRTIKLPSTKANDMFFGLNFEVTNEGLFNDKVQIPITINRIEFRGFMQLNGVGIADGKTDSYSINIFSGVADWTSLIGGKSINELSFLSSHSYTEANIRDSWNANPLINQYVYPLIDYNVSLRPIGRAVDGNPGEQRDFYMGMGEWMPAFFVYPLLVNIFKEAGFRFIGEHLSKETLGNLILPFFGDHEDITGTIEHKDVIQDIKQLDLLKEVIALGNYRIVTDNISKTVDFVPESSFLNNSAKDWTGKKDNSKNINISLIRNDGARSMVFTYDNDTTDSTIEKIEAGGYTRVAYNVINYGGDTIILESEHRSGVQNIHKSIFSATVDDEGLPVMSKSDNINNNNGIPIAEFRTDFKNRILLWGGMQSIPQVTSGTRWPFWLRGETMRFFFFGIESTVYPYAYFANEDYSLSYNQLYPISIYSLRLSQDPPVTEFGVTYGKVVGSGIVDSRYTGTIRSLNNSKMLKGYFWLDDYDIATLDFGRPIIVNDVQYYINKVIDYRVGANQPTQVELISRV